ncbi:abortive infection family protein [Porphyromonas asaccharolytica]|uniref:Abortive infection protein-like C-terminal domain-containing protein n=1 Tax=Porphyromonas asaccharolytica (strain ATCC 25260 / DSM 20707 / BCRC 10618 / CCUG 7834 / JCM 6326 / LMG 13178 / VPI 4198 / B440) TaxID=879243 RepID=F4KKL0_PORAD|nr:abortive infection family protein [Porphyromonas asaccharolytica]AEE12935.1 hypothetical protein Poras_0992 [Porphyromonas asaccharolytica DSM 20707]
MSSLDVEIDACLNFFNDRGCVLDFGKKDFDEFTAREIGVPVCKTYQESRGKSLMAYVYDSETPKRNVIKLFAALIRHYELSEALQNDRSNNPKRYQQYENCKAIIEREFNALGEKPLDLSDPNSFNSEYIRDQIDLMRKFQETNPTEAIGKAKELIESYCKTILEEEKIAVDPKWNMTKLVDELFKHFKLMPSDIEDDIKGAKSIKQILGSLKAITQGLAELRNFYGSGHGKTSSYKGLQQRHARLAVGSAIVLIQFICDTHERNKLHP